MTQDQYRATWEIPWGNAAYSSMRWAKCELNDCHGEAIQDTSRCVLHATEEQRVRYFETVANGQPLRLSGLTLTKSDLDSIIRQLPKWDDEGVSRPLIPGTSRFVQTVFQDGFDASYTAFIGPAHFMNASFNKSRVISGASFEGARFENGLDLTLAEVSGNANLSNASISGSAKFDGLRCSGQLTFRRARIDCSLEIPYVKTAGISLAGARIGGDLKALEANFTVQGNDSPEYCRRAVLSGCTITGHADFTRAQFPHESMFGLYENDPPLVVGSKLILRSAQFGSAVEGGAHSFRQAKISDLDLTGCRFHGKTGFHGMSVEKSMDFTDVEFSDVEERPPKYPSREERRFPTRALDFTDVSCKAGIEIRNVRVKGQATIKIAEGVPHVEIDGLVVQGNASVEATNFDTYTSMTIEAGELTFRRCQFIRGGIILCRAESLHLLACDARQAVTFETPYTAGGPLTRIVSLASTNVENIVLFDMDLSEALFSAAVNLDHLRTFGRSSFFQPRQISSRRVILDEIVVRANSSGWWRRSLAKKWRDRLPARVADFELGTASAADAYRSLRKNREDSKDHAGSSDFYFGEMEMRRITASFWSVERWLLTVYWLVSGYGLRSFRACALLLGVLAVSGVLLQQFGFVSHAIPSFIESCLLVAQVSLGLKRSPQTLSPEGSIVIVVARLLLPLLLALALLAVRARVKR